MINYFQYQIQEKYVKIMKANEKTVKKATSKKSPVKKVEIIPDAPETIDFPKMENNPKKINMPELTKMMASDFNLNPENRNNHQPQQQAQPSAELKVYSVNTIIEEEPLWGTTIQVTPWVNGTGYEIILCNKNGAFQHLSLTKEDADLINRMVKRLSGS